MFNFCSLYSGSTGNCLFIESDKAKILIDVGVSAKKIIDALTSINISIHEIDAILITHEHIDHTKALHTIANKYNIPVFANIETWNSLPEQNSKIETSLKKYFTVFEKFCIKDLEILPFSIPHDAANPCGFNIYNFERKISIATDLGHMNKNILSHLENSNFIMLESNYDPSILKYSSYPYLLKKRIGGPNGHLSNDMAGKTISELIPKGLKTVMLGHLSKENNFPELAYETVLNELNLNNYNETSVNLSIANRDKPSEIIKVS